MLFRGYRSGIYRLLFCTRVCPEYHSSRSPVVAKVATEEGIEGVERTFAKIDIDFYSRDSLSRLGSSLARHIRKEIVD